MLLILVILFFTSSLYAVNQHQIYLYMGGGYSQQSIDLRSNIYDTGSVGTGLGYRWNRFLSDESINFFSLGFSLGGGAIFSKARQEQSILNNNSFLELEVFAGYGVALGKNKAHQMSILGIGVLPKFYGLLERDSFTRIGGTEREWYKGYYIPISVGVHLPSYRYVQSRFFVGFSHSVNILVGGHKNVNVPSDNLILRSVGYVAKLEIGWNYDNFTKVGTGRELEETRLFVETNRGTVLISLFAKVNDEETKFVNVEIFALGENEKAETANLIAYASKIPVYNGQAQFTKYWRDNKNYFDEKMKEEKTEIYVVIKELDKEDNILHSQDIREYLTRENKDEMV